MENLAIELLIKHFKELLALFILPFTVMIGLLVNTCSLLFGQTDAYAACYQNRDNLGQKTEEDLMMMMMRHICLRVASVFKEDAVFAAPRTLTFKTLDPTHGWSCHMP